MVRPLAEEVEKKTKEVLYLYLRGKHLVLQDWFWLYNACIQSAEVAQVKLIEMLSQKVD